MSSGRFNRSIKGLLRVITLASFLCLCLVGVLASRGASTTISHDKHNVNKHHQVNHEVLTVGRGKLLPRSEMDINYMSKRKVPNGPDPIHNRRAGNSRRPPGQA